MSIRVLESCFGGSVGYIVYTYCTYTVHTVYLMPRVMGTTTLSLNNYLNLSHYIPEVYEGCQVGGGGGLVNVAYSHW